MTKLVQKRKIAEEAAAGLSAGVVGTVIGHPLDLIKTRMQIMKGRELQKLNIGRTGATGLGAIWTMSESIWVKEGPRGFFKGLMPPLASLSVISSVSFAAYSWFRQFYGASHGWDVRNGLAGFSCGPVTSAITTMENLVRTQMQIDNIKEKQFRGSWHCTATLVRNYGIQTLFTGHVMTTLRDATYLCTYFYVYEGMKMTLMGNNEITDYNSNNWVLKPQFAVPIAGGTSGAMAWLGSLPVDCVRAGVQGQNLDNVTLSDDGKTIKNPRKNGRQVFRELMVKRGIRGLYRGVTPTLVRAFIVSGTRFSAYEWTLWLLRQHQLDG